MFEVIVFILACIGAVALLCAAVIAIALIRSGHTPPGGM